MKRRSTLWRTQNFLRSSAVIGRIARRAGIVPADLVLDIGAGTGVITDVLRARGARVVAMEADPRLCAHLARRYADDPSVRVVCQDARWLKLPAGPYKVFANLPFEMTGAIVSKLTTGIDPPEDSFLIVQEEAADRFLGSGAVTLYSLLLKPWFSGRVIHRFRRDNFTPRPRVDPVMVRLRRRKSPLISSDERGLYRDFVVACFTAWRPSVASALDRVVGSAASRRILRRASEAGLVKPSELPPGRWIELFKAFSGMSDRTTARVRGAERRLRAQQEGVRKLHRTRVPRDDLSRIGHRRTAATMRTWPRVKFALQ